MSGMIRKSLDSPEEVRPFEDGKGHLDLVNLDFGDETSVGVAGRWRHLSGFRIDVGQGNEEDAAS